MTLEVHEAAVTDAASMRVLHKEASDLNIQIAYDDFGVGQSRLVTLHSMRPAYVKFDKSLIHHIDNTTTAQRRMVAYLVRMVCDLSIVPLAEGVERKEEHAVICDLGFELGQGWLYGKPDPRPKCDWEDQAT
jgi:EAL domain-containing protein (putative c-di-GMP-specific phosphodiesterase class I)